MKLTIQRGMHRMALFVGLAGALLLVLLSGCEKRQEPEGYRVTGYDAATNQWTILRTGTFGGKYLRKRLTVICSFYKWGNHQPNNGPEACHLSVGALIVPNPFPTTAPAPGKPRRREEFLDIWEMPSERLAISEGYGDDRVEQQFEILKYEVLPDSAGCP